MDANQQLEDRLAQLEVELSQARHSLEERDTELTRLRSEVEQATLEAQRVAEQRSQALEERLVKEAESSLLRAEVEKLRSLEELREEHQRATERERKLMDDWMRDVKERFKVEKQHLEERISVLEATKLRAPSGSEASGSPTHARRSVGSPGDPYPSSEVQELELSDGSERKSGLEENRSAANNETSPNALARPTDPTLSDSDVAPEPPTSMRTMTKLLQAAMVAQALATAVRHLPPLPLYTGEKEQAEDEGVL